MQRGMMKIRPRFLICGACGGQQKSRRAPGMETRVRRYILHIQHLRYERLRGTICSVYINLIAEAFRNDRF